MSYTAVIRYPLAPLLAAMGCTLSQAQNTLGLGGPEYRKYRDEGMARDVAERKANRAGYHVYEIWPEAVEHDLAEAEEADDERRLRKNAQQREYYRRHRERALAAQRERDRQDADVKRRAAAAWRRRNKERQAAYKRAYYEANAERIREQQREYERNRRKRAA